MKAARRDASWFQHPGQSWRYHLYNDLGWPFCGYLALADEETETEPAEVPTNLRCQRNGCKQRWPKTTVCGRCDGTGTVWTENRANVEGCPSCGGTGKPVVMS